MPDEKITLKSLQKHIILTITAMMIVSSGIPVGIYYNMKYTQRQQQVDINEAKQDIKNIKANMTAMMLAPAQNIADIQAMYKMLAAIEQRQIALDRRIDDFYNSRK